MTAPATDLAVEAHNHAGQPVPTSETVASDWANYQPSTRSEQAAILPRIQLGHESSVTFLVARPAIGRLWLGSAAVPKDLDLTTSAVHENVRVARKTRRGTLLRCRTAALGGHIDACSGCGYQAISFNSCRNRHWPRCQANARDRWLEAHERTRAHALRPRSLYLAAPTSAACAARTSARSLLFATSAETPLEVARDPNQAPPRGSIRRPPSCRRGIQVEARATLCP
jgi:hypothetical protein